MNNRMNTTNLSKLTNSLVSDALDKIRQGRKNSPSSMEPHFRTAEYLLLEAKEYVDGAWEMLEYNKCGASLALSRWVLEASIDLFWAVADKNNIEQRLRDLGGEALRCEANLREGLVNLWPSQACDLKNQAKKARAERKTLGAKKLENMERRIQDIKQIYPNCPALYDLYRICCAEAHPSLKIWERFVKVGSTTVTTVSKNPIDERWIACWIAAASTLYLVSGTYCLTELGNAQLLKDWWSNQAIPLIEDAVP